MDLLSLLRRPEGKTLEFKRDLSSPAGVPAEMKREAANEVFDETPLPESNSEALDFRVASELFRSRRVLRPAEQ